MVAHTRKALVAVVALAVAASLSMVLVPSGAGATRSVRGFDGTTIKVAALGQKSQLPNAEFGARARIKRFNDTNELKGIKIDYKEYADDKQDPATALSETRRLVTEDGIFALVGDESVATPSQYLVQQHVPFFGGGFNVNYCSPKVTTSLWGFAPGGCVVPTNPPFVYDFLKPAYEYLSKTTGKKHPTMVLYGNDIQSGKNAVRNDAVAAEGAGFKVTGTLATIPEPSSVSDYTPYVEKVLSSGANGGPPDATDCVMATQCLNMYQQMAQRGWKGMNIHPLYTDILVKPLNGSAVDIPFANLSDSTAGVRQFRADLDAYQAGFGATKADLGSTYAYAATDMFIQALKTVAKKGKSNITPEAVQKAASTMTWQIKGLMGPIKYPKATVMTYPACFSFAISDGTKWVTKVPFACSSKTYNPNLKLG